MTSPPTVLPEGAHVHAHREMQETYFFQGDSELDLDMCHPMVPLHDRTSFQNVGGQATEGSQLPQVCLRRATSSEVMPSWGTSHALTGREGNIKPWPCGPNSGQPRWETLAPELPLGGVMPMWQCPSLPPFSCHRYCPFCTSRPILR